MAFYRVPMEFLLAILCALTTLSLRFHGAHNACTALSRRLHCADGVLKTFVCITERSKSSSVVCLFTKLKPYHFGTAGPAYRYYVGHSERNAYLHISFL